jgi:hypothetical protein
MLDCFCVTCLLIVDVVFIRVYQVCRPVICCCRRSIMFVLCVCVWFVISLVNGFTCAVSINMLVIFCIVGGYGVRMVVRCCIVDGSPNDKYCIVKSNRALKATIFKYSY